jgi:hypothetical protein
MAVRAPAIRHALHDEAGGVTVLALFSLILTVLCVGFAVDASNLYRYQAMLRMAADTAAHAGASALARGATAEAAEAAALEILARNMTADPKDLLADPGQDLRAMVVNSADGTLSKPDPDTRANAMLVSLQHSKAAHNPIPTLVLGLFGFDSWSAGATSVAVISTTRRCENAAGLFAQGSITIGSDGNGMVPGDGLCVHSQQALSLPEGRDSLAEAPRLSLPSRVDCSGGDCANAAEVNLIMPDIGTYVARMAGGFADPGQILQEERDFFADRPIARDLEPLLEIGAEVRTLQTGSVVALSPFRFRLLRDVPPGLVYLVLCGQPGAEIEAGKQEEIIVGEWEESPALRDIALVTSCPIRLAEHARIEGALVISTAEENGMAGAAPGAMLGDPNGTCDAARRSVVMTTRDLVLPSHLLTSNLAAVAAGDVQLGLTNDMTSVRGRGIAVHAGGDILGTGTQSFMPCPAAADPVLPALRVISHTMPPLDGWVTPVHPEVETDLPGTQRNLLELQDRQS